MFDHQRDSLARYFDGVVAREVGADGRIDDVSSKLPAGVIAAWRRLQDIVDYRAALQEWFAGIQEGGHLIITVPHAFLYDRQMSLPSRRRPQQRRLYTPASLLGEIEEALAPNSYRIRLLRDDDHGYDYGDARDEEPTGAADAMAADIVAVIERIAPPEWGLHQGPAKLASAPDYAFEPARTRVERAARMAAKKIILLKLDHLGDFVMGVPSLRRARETYADAHITLVVGSWNYDMAVALDVADEVIAFDLYPRNSSEERVDVVGKTSLFEATIPGEYDLAVDLRIDPDTRFLLKSINAGLRAALGSRIEFPFLDIFLPIDLTRHEPEIAREDVIGPRHFQCRDYCVRSDFRISSSADQPVDAAAIWGPYRSLRQGEYIFEPFIELGPASDGLLFVDVALDQERVQQAVLPSSEPVRLRFSVRKPGALFEFRIGRIAEHPGIDFSFFGGRLIRQGASSVLHQSEYASLLIELVAMRTRHFGVQREAATPG